MKRLKYGRMPEITRTMYDKVRRYDRLKFTAFCEELYQNGFTDGRESAPAVDPEKLLAALKDSPGIGPRTIAKTMDRVREVFGTEEQTDP